MKTSCDSEYAHSYLLAQQLPERHLAKLQFDPLSRLATVADWQGYLQRLGITTKLAVKLVTEAALLGSAVEHGLSPELIILSDGARQFDLLVHALCWVHMERGLRRLPGQTAGHRQQIQEVQTQCAGVLPATAPLPRLSRCHSTATVSSTL